MSKATRKIHNFDFKKAHHHVALVDKAANLTEVMVMKSDHEVTITTSMRDFLTKFYGMWSEDAAALAGVLGYSNGKVSLTANNDDLAHDYGGVYDNFPKYVNEDGSNPMMYKSANEFLTGEFSSLDVLKGSELPETLPYSVTQKIVAVNKAYDFLLKTSDESSEEDNINIAKGDSNLELTKEEIAKQAEDLKIALAAVETMKAAKNDELETMKSLVADMKSEKEAVAKTNMAELVKGYAFVAEDAQEALVAELLTVTDNTEILKALEAGREAVAASVNLGNEDGASGTDAGDAADKTEVSKGNDATIALLNKRKGAK